MFARPSRPTLSRTYAEPVPCSGGNNQKNRPYNQCTHKSQQGDPPNHGGNTPTRTQHAVPPDQLGLDIPLLTLKLMRASSASKMRANDSRRRSGFMLCHLSGESRSKKSDYFTVSRRWLSQL